MIPVRVLSEKIRYEVASDIIEWLSDTNSVAFHNTLPGFRLLTPRMFPSERYPPMVPAPEIDHMHRCLRLMGQPSVWNFTIPTIVTLNVS